MLMSFNFRDFRCDTFDVITLKLLKAFSLNMGAHNEFGSLPVHIRRVVYYSLSPFEQDPWVHSVSRGVPNMVKRFCSALPAMAPGKFIFIKILELLLQNAMEIYVNFTMIRC